MPIKSLKKSAVVKLPKKERMIAHIMESEMKSGKSKKKAEEIAYGHMMKLKKK